MPLDPGKRSTIYRTDRAVVRIGRDPDNEIVLDDLLVSRHHADLRGNETDGFEIVDASSHNGTFVNGRRVDRCALGSSDVIAIGHHQFHLVGDVLEEYLDEGEITFEAQGLTVCAPNNRVLLDNVSFGLDRNTFLAVVGPSGAGKSTLLNALTGFRPASQGTVLYDGRDLYAEYEELQSRIGLVPQDDVLHPQLTVGRALEFAAELRFADDVTADERSDRVGEVLEELGLTARRDLPIDQLSGGQRKRVSVALELLTKPSLLFLDEPTSGLDPGYERSLMELLRGLADGGRTIVVVTHSVQSLDLCDRVLFLAPGGRTAYFGPADEARRYFRRDDFQEVFRDLGGDAVIDWTGQFELDPAYERYVSRPAARAAAAARTGGPPPTPTREQAWWRQFSTLTRRYVVVLARDRRNLALVLAQAPVLGVLMLVALPAGELKLPPRGEVRLVSTAALVLWVVGMGATWLGASNAAREIVKELPIFRRERAAGLSLSAYIASKAVVL
ncbi:MAG TPA: ATP-binding cassette domain-containing protein, partial [Acidimicrobiia bacterium]